MFSEFVALTPHPTVPRLPGVHPATSLCRHSFPISTLSRPLCLRQTLRAQMTQRLKCSPTPGRPPGTP